MPIYEYRCATCSASFEKFQRNAGGDGASPCPTCGGSAQRTISMFANPRGASPDASSSEYTPPPAEPAGGHGHGHSHGFGGHGHSHGPGGHSH